MFLHKEVREQIFLYIISFFDEIYLLDTIELFLIPLRDWLLMLLILIIRNLPLDVIMFSVYIPLEFTCLLHRIEF